MPYFKDKDNNTFLGEYEDCPLDKWTEITFEEAEAINAQKRGEQFDALNYAEKRLSEYTPIGDQLDALLKHVNGDSTELKAIAELHKNIKTKYPKN